MHLRQIKTKVYPIAELCTNYFVPKKHLGKNFPQICSLEKLKAPLLFQAIKPNIDCKIQIHALKTKNCTELDFIFLVIVNSL